MKYTEDSPYGYWIGKNEIIAVVQEECHYEVACEMILGRDGRRYSAYAIMFRLGYVRVVNYSDGDCGVELWKNHKPSKLQKQFIESASIVDYRKKL